MTIDQTTTVAEIASALPASVRLFQRHGIDFCCGGKTPLATVCQQKGIPFADVTRALDALPTGPAGDDRDWTREPLARLADHIVATYHDALRDELPRLEGMAVKVAKVHGARAPHLVRLASVVQELSADLHAHMQKEEGVLFPAIRALERGAARGSIAAPIAVMEHEHDSAGAALARMRELTGDYEPPMDACNTFRASLDGLAELERDTHQHVHKENNVLFPRALEQEVALQPPARG